MSSKYGRLKGTQHQLVIMEGASALFEAIPLQQYPVNPEWSPSRRWVFPCGPFTLIH
jgi:hypothetical protein